MAFSLYDASVANYLQTLGAVSGFLDRALAHFEENNIDPEAIVETRLAMGDPATQLVAVSQEQGVDLIAMSTHGHRFIKDILLGATADKVRHLVKVHVLLLRAQ